MTKRKKNEGTITLEVPEGTEKVEVIWPDGDMDTLTPDGLEEDDEDEDEDE